MSPLNNPQNTDLISAGKDTKMEPNSQDMQTAYRTVDSIRAETEKAIVGKNREIALLLATILSGGHALIEDIPGVGKTALASALAKATGLSFRRAQFTPDVMASDITGFNIYNKASEKFEFREGIVMTNLVLADEINRAAPKTQSSLLEAMEERQVTVDGKTYALPDPFIVIATQNPLGYVGTNPLPEAQLDRFSIRLTLGYPTEEEELKILRERKDGNPIDGIRQVANSDIMKILISLTEKVFLSEDTERYIVSLVSATRRDDRLLSGASPRASLVLMRLSRAIAFIRHRNFVTPDDVADIFTEAVAHRITVKREIAAAGIKAADILNGILADTPVPFDLKKKNRV